MGNCVNYISIYFSLKYKTYKIRYVHWFTDCSNMTVIWVNWTSFLGECSISWVSETLKDTSFLTLMFPGGKGNVLNFLCPFFFTYFFSPHLEIILAMGRLCFHKPNSLPYDCAICLLLYQSRENCSIYFLQYLLFITLAQSMGMVVNIQLYSVQKTK